MTRELIAIRFDPDATPQVWEFQLVEDGVRKDFYRTMKSGEENNPTRITLTDPEDPSVNHDLVLFRTVSVG